MTHDWTAQAIDLLRRQRLSPAAWPYKPGSTPATEPTALAALALLACDPADPITRQAAASLALQQRPDGSLSIAPNTPGPSWPTAHALLLWANIEGFKDQSLLASRFLLDNHGRSWKTTTRCVLGHDPSIPGWSWVAETHAWVEPTALAMLALTRAGQAETPRVQQGIQLLADRALATGGWNFGNPQMFGQTLRPQLMPTALALLALAGREKPSTPCVSQGLRYLEDQNAPLHAPQSLAWRSLALKAWNRASEPDPLHSASLLSQSFHALSSSRHNLTTCNLAALLLAAAPNPLKLLLMRLA